MSGLSHRTKRVDGVNWHWVEAGLRPAPGAVGHQDEPLARQVPDVVAAASVYAGILAGTTQEFQASFPATTRLNIARGSLRERVQPVA